MFTPQTRRAPRPTVSGAFARLTARLGAGLNADDTSSTLGHGYRVARALLSVAVLLSLLTATAQAQYVQVGGGAGFVRSVATYGDIGATPIAVADLRAGWPLSASTSVEFEVLHDVSPGTLSLFSMGVNLRAAASNWRVSPLIGFGLHYGRRFQEHVDYPDGLVADGPMARFALGGLVRLAGGLALGLDANLTLGAAGGAHARLLVEHTF